MSLAAAAHAPVPWLAAASLLALASLLMAAVGADAASRRIANRVCIAVALLALPWWCGMAADPAAALASQLALAGATALPLVPIFSLRLLGGGDVKLIAAIALFLPPVELSRMLVATALCGAALGLIMWMWSLFALRRIRSVPYAVAIAAGTTVALAPAARDLIGALA